MKCKLIVILIVILGSTVHFAQQIKINVGNLESDKAILFVLSGENILTNDTITSINSEFIFSLEGNHSGIYRLTFNNISWIDFIYDGGDIFLKSDANNIFDSLKVIKSESNKIYYEFLELNKSYKTKTELLQIILARYPKEDNYYQISREKLIRVQEEYLYFVNVTSQVNPNSFVARYVRSAQFPVVKTEIPFDEQLTYLKTHSLDNVNFYNDELIFSDAFTSKSIEYLTYYRNPQLPLALLEKEFMIAVDSILSKAKVSEIVYQHIVEYLIDGFKKFGFEKVIDYIVENYVIKDNLCLNEELTNSLENRIEQAINLKIGSKVPNIVFSDSIGTNKDLDNISTEQILILFYASWCSHCQILIPQLSELYINQKEKNTEVIAVSIDTSKTDLLKFISSNNLDWINVADLKGWDGKAATDYFLYATPTMFLVDKRLKLIAKPLSIDELHIWF